MQMISLGHDLFLKFGSSTSSAKRQEITCKWSLAAVKVKEKESAPTISITSALWGAMYLQGYRIPFQQWVIKSHFLQGLVGIQVFYSKVDNIDGRAFWTNESLIPFMQRAMDLRVLSASWAEWLSQAWGNYHFLCNLSTRGKARSD